jgi:hypothetical protein
MLPYVAYFILRVILQIWPSNFQIEAVTEFENDTNLVCCAVTYTDRSLLCCVDLSLSKVMHSIKINRRVKIAVIYHFYCILILMKYTANYLPGSHQTRHFNF